MHFLATIFAWADPTIYFFKTIHEVYFTSHMLIFLIFSIEISKVEIDVDPPTLIKGTS